MRVAASLFFYDTEFISFTLIITCIVSEKLLPASKDAEGVFACETEWIGFTFSFLYRLRKASTDEFELPDLIGPRPSRRKPSKVYGYFFACE